MIVLAGILRVCTPWMLHGQPITLTEAVRTAETQDPSIHLAELEREKALHEVGVVRTRRFTFSITALGSQPLTLLGIRSNEAMPCRTTGSCYAGASTSWTVILGGVIWLAPKAVEAGPQAYMAAQKQ